MAKYNTFKCIHGHNEAPSQARLWRHSLLEAKLLEENKVPHGATDSAYRSMNWNHRDSRCCCTALLGTLRHLAKYVGMGAKYTLCSSNVESTSYVVYLLYFTPLELGKYHTELGYVASLVRRNIALCANV